MIPINADMASESSVCRGDVNDHDTIANVSPENLKHWLAACVWNALSSCVIIEHNTFGIKIYYRCCRGSIFSDRIIF